jgi:hypothetical protein
MSDEQGEMDPNIVAGHREHVDGHGDRDPDANPHTATVRDSSLSRFLSVLEQDYDPREAKNPEEMPGSARDLQLVKDIRAMEATEAGREAVESNDMATLQHHQGNTAQRADISGMKAIQQLDQIIESAAPVIVVLGEMGHGKTDFACLLAQRAKHLLGVEKVASNVASLQETDPWVDDNGEARDGFVPGHSTLLEWVKQDGDPLENEEQSQKLFIGDEFSSRGSGTGKSGYLMRQKMGPLVYKIRKYNGLLIYIAHDPSSIHPLLWRLGVIVQKTDKKDAIIADKVKSGEVRDERARITGIPATDWRYNTKEASQWSWTETEDGEQPEPGEVAYDVAMWTVRECKEDGLSHRDTASYVPFGKSWVSDRWTEIKAGEHGDALDRVEAITA